MPTPRTGRRGRPAKPGALRLLDGRTNHASRTPDEVPPEAGPCDPPETLSAEARAVWSVHQHDLELRGLLHPRNLDTFALYANAVISYRRAQALLDRAGPLVTGHDGRLISNPASREARYWAAVILRVGVEFGMTPAALTSMYLRAEQPNGRAPERLLK